MWGLDRKEGRVPKNWCLRPVVIDKTLESPFTARKSNQSSLKEVNPEYSLEGLMLKLKLHYFGHLMWIANSLEKTLMLEKIEGRSRRGQQWMRWLDGITNSLDMNWAKSGRYWRTGKPGATVHGVAENQTQLSDWTTTRGLRQFRRWPCFWAPWLWPWGKTPQSMVDL